MLQGRSFLLFLSLLSIDVGFIELSGPKIIRAVIKKRHQLKPRILINSLSATGYRRLWNSSSYYATPKGSAVSLNKQEKRAELFFRPDDRKIKNTVYSRFYLFIFFIRAELRKWLRRRVGLARFIENPPFFRNIKDEPRVPWTFLLVKSKVVEPFISCNRNSIVTPIFAFYFCYQFFSYPIREGKEFDGGGE